MATGFYPVEPYLAQLTPPDVLQLPSDASQHISIEPPTFTLGPSLAVHFRLSFDHEVAFGIPGLDAVQLVIGPTADGTPVDVDFAADPIPNVTVTTALILRLASELLKPVRPVSGQSPGAFELDPTRSSVEIDLATVTLTVNIDGDLSVTGGGSIDLPLCMIGDSGVVIKATGITLHLDSTSPPPGKPAGWKGVHIASANLYLPGDLGHSVGNLSLTDGFIGNGGFSGTVASDWTSPLAAQVFGMTVSLSHASLTFVQNALTASEIRGKLTLPFFDEPVQVEIGIGMGGDLHITLDSTDPDGLYELTKPGLLDLKLDSIGFELKDGLFTAKIAGKLTPLFGGLDWPTFDVKELSIDSKGHIHLDGGWLNVPEQKTLDFHGFKIEISQIGFGTNDNGTRWVGFSGGLHLVDGLQAGASVEGLRITWDPAEAHPVPKITLNGVGVELSIPGVLYFKGEVSFRELDGTTPGEKIRRFDGHIHLILENPELEIDGTLVIGSVKGPQGRYNFLGVYVDADLPAGIALASTGLAIYGFAGLFALQMEPDKHSDEMWFSIDHSKSYFHRGTPGITDIKAKWKPTKGSFAVGLGITLGSLPDSGYSLNGKLLLAIVIPGPILLLQGAMTFLKKRVGGQDEGKFRALAVLDGRASTFLIGLDAEYKTGKGGELIEISGSMEAFYSFNDPTAWHLWLGENEPRSLRIRALFAKLVEANAYFMLDAHQLALGVWYGFNNGWNFGPLSIRLEAWVDGNALVSFKPTQLKTDLWLHGLVDLKAFGFGFGLVLDAKITADLFKPYHLRGEFSVGIKLPWPFKKKKVGARIVMEWGPRKHGPPLPLPVATIGIEHLKSSVTWPLQRGTFLLPSYDDGEGFLTAPGTYTEPSETAVPRVPVDARIAVTFGRSVHDEAKVGSNLQAIAPAYEVIGDPNRGGVLSVRYVLDGVTLERKVNSGWQTVASSPKTAGSGPPPLWGQWAIVPQLPDAGAKPPNPGQTKLLLGAKTPFEFNRHTGASWEEWVSDALPGYPCIPVQPGEETCFGFTDLTPGTQLESPWTFAGPPAVTFSWDFGPATVSVRPVTGESHVQPVPLLCFPKDAVQHGIRVHLQAPASRFRLILARTDSQVGPIVEPGPIKPGPGPGTRGSRLEPASGSGTSASPIALALDPDASGPRGEVSPDPGTLVPRGEHPPRRGPVEVTEVVPREAVPTCVNVRARAAGTLANPWKAEEGARFTVLGADGALLPVARVERWDQGELGLNAGFQLEIDLPCPALWVTLLVTHRPPFRIVAFNASGMAVATYAPNGTGGTSTETIRLDGPAMTRVVIYASGNEKLIHQVCFLCPRLTGPQATGFGIDGTSFGPFGQFEGVIPIAGPEIHDVVITGDGPFCLEQVCITPDPEAGQGVRQDERIQHQIDELAHWQAEGEVLAPDSFYRLTVKTRLDLNPPNPDLDGLPADRWPVEHAYFRTGGPPGLTVLSQPAGVTTDPFVTGLEDLTRYVRETTPPTVPPPGEKPILFKPFYRAYDVGLEFNEDYVEQMYRMDGRDLGLYLYDASNQPARDGLGRLLVIGDQWGKAETLSLSEKETRWITLIDAATCLPKKLDPQTFPKDSALTSSDPGRVLAPDTLYEARLVPMLLHETFPGNVLGKVPDGWSVEDAGPGGSSSWKVGEAGEAGNVNNPPSRFVEQLSPIGGINSPERPGTLLLLAAAGAWTDYRVSVYLRAAAGAVGVVVRYQGPGTGYWFSLDDQARRLVKGGATLLAEDHVAYPKNRDSLVTVEAIGKFLRAYVDGEPVFDVEDGDFVAGGLGLYSCQSPGARFTDVRVDDFGAAAPVIYRFQLTTSLYANFFHHLHSFQDETWKAGLGTDPAVDALLNEAVAPSFSPPSEKEARAYDDLAQRALGPAALQNPARVEVTRLEKAGTPVAFLLRSPEPLAWDRIEFTLSGTPRHLPAPETPGTVKLVEATFGAILPVEESVTLLLREAADLSRYRVELRALPGVLAEPVLDTDALARDRFAAGDLTGWSRIDEALGTQPSTMQAAGGELILSSFVVQGGSPDDPGTYAYTGDAGWTDVIYSARLRCPSGGALGLVFRARDLKNLYRFSMSAGSAPYRRLIKRVNGTATVLWEDGGSYATDRSHELTVVAVGSSLRGSLNGIPVFAVEDGDLPSGLISLYARDNSDAHFSQVRVFPADRAFAGWRLDESFDRLVPGRWSFQDAAQPLPDGWAVESGELRPAGDDPAGLRIALTGDPAAADYRLAVRLRPGLAGLTGVVFRFLDVDNSFVFLNDSGSGVLRMVKRVKGQETVLWQGTGVMTAGREIGLTFDAVGERLAGWLDGVELFRVDDADLPVGRVGFFAAGSPDARFTEVRVTEPEWTPWYGFGGEDPLPAGTRVRIHAGPETAAPPAEAGIERRFAAALGETGRLRFPAEGVELRVVGPEGPGHQRTFVPPVEYVALTSPRMVRRADGTGLVLLPFGSPAPLIEGQYRLELLYHRERPGQVHSFSQAGDRSPERAVIDIPWPAR